MPNDGQTQSTSEQPASQQPIETTPPPIQSQPSDSELPPLTVTTDPVMVIKSRDPGSESRSGSQIEE